MKDTDPKIFALQMHDRVLIIADLIMEHFLAGNSNPPQELIDAYFNAVDDAGIALNADRMHEQVVRANAEFYDEMQDKFGLENKKKNLDTTPDLF